MEILPNIISWVPDFNIAVFYVGKIQNQLRNKLGSCSQVLNPVSNPCGTCSSLFPGILSGAELSVCPEWEQTHVHAGCARALWQN